MKVNDMASDKPGCRAQRSVSSEAQDIFLASEMVKLGARLQVLQAHD